MNDIHWFKHYFFVKGPPFLKNITPQTDMYAAFTFNTYGILFFPVVIMT
jgi:hypothetical protein